MSKQNIYDNETFFDGYKKIRDTAGNANDVFEMPALFSLLPDLKNQTVLDLGCGFGEHCIHYIEQGAKKVVGIDISEKMLAIAKAENSHPNISYLHMPMEDLAGLDMQFDVVISSLAIHYVENYGALAKDVYRLLNPGGLFIFSQEHPLCTCYTRGDRWTQDEEGNFLYVNLSNYGVEGERDSKWFVENVRKYHRTFSTIVNTLLDAGFTVERVLEPLPDQEILKQYPAYSRLFHKPDFLLVRARK
ncbi:MAG TPA: class I SAM-dependent methyltransferase [Candidatus Ventrimonas merdavium]|nr:class I SAM-dependent methyltransferase [Candidatus Ventrimonas merdavium]